MGTSREELLALGTERAMEGYSVTIATELGDGRHPGELVRERQRRAHSRTAGKRQTKKPTRARKRPQGPLIEGQLSWDLDLDERGFVD
ncbi:hypothetical protein [Streptomyces sp. NPDC046371]|uniref:hypothetical protein n=1 Tax=Streptomyces sp. NPDC046371 TaxID=3154916 RepID=UPI0033D846B6